MKNFPRNDGSGVVRGDDKAMPDRGVNTGVTDTYGSNLQQGYDNGGSIKSSTQSDAAHESDSDSRPDADD